MQGEEEKKKINNLNEAPTSATVKVRSKQGFEWLFTMRDDTVNDLVLKIEKMEVEFTKRGWTPLAQNSGFSRQPKQVDYVEGKACPTCEKRLVYGVTKTGKKFIKCETQKWNFATKQPEGCAYISWEVS